MDPFARYNTRSVDDPFYDYDNDFGDDAIGDLYGGEFIDYIPRELNANEIESVASIDNEYDYLTINFGDNNIITSLEHEPIRYFTINSPAGNNDLGDEYVRAAHVHDLAVIRDCSTIPRIVSNYFQALDTKSGFVINGFFHIIAAVRAAYFHKDFKNHAFQEQSDNRSKIARQITPIHKEYFRLVTFVTQHNIINIGNNLFATLSFNQNPSSHQFIKDTVRSALQLARMLLLTGGLGGLPRVFLEQVFGSFTINLNHVAGTSVKDIHGVRFRKFVLKEYPLTSLLGNNSVDEAFLLQVEEDYEKAYVAWHEHRAERDTRQIMEEDDDQGDLLCDAVTITQLLKSKQYVAASHLEQQRLETVVFKFKPRAPLLNDKNPVGKHISHFEPRVVDATVDRYDVTINGTKKGRLLSSHYLPKTLEPDNPAQWFKNVRQNQITPFQQLENDTFYTYQNNEKQYNNEYFQRRDVDLINRQQFGFDGQTPTTVNEKIRVSDKAPNEKTIFYPNLDGEIYPHERLREVYAITDGEIDGKLESSDDLSNDDDVSSRSLSEERCTMSTPSRELFFERSEREPLLSVNARNNNNNTDVLINNHEDLDTYLPTPNNDIFAKTPNFVGCKHIDEKEGKLEASLARLSKNNDETAKLWIPPADLSNDCLLQCLIKATRKNIQPHTVRLLLGMKDGNLIDIYKINLGDFFDADIFYYRIENAETKIQNVIAGHLPEVNILQRMVEFHKDVREDGIQRMNKVFILSLNNHAYWVKHESFFNVLKCKKCCQWIVATNIVKHDKVCFHCSKCSTAYNTSRGKIHDCSTKKKKPFTRLVKGQKRKHDMSDGGKPLMLTAEFNHKITAFKNVYAADFEAYVNKRGEFKVYAAGYASLEDKKAITFYGKDALRDFIASISCLIGKMYFYNMGKYDGFLLIKKIIEENEYLKVDLNPSSLVFSNSHIIELKINKLSVSDALPFFGTALKKALIAYGVPSNLEKKSLDHNLIKDKTCVEIYMKEIVEYFEVDILGLAALMKIFAKNCHEVTKIDVFKTRSPAHYAQLAWSAQLPEEYKKLLCMITNKEEDDILRASLYGGMVLPGIKNFIAKELIEDCHDQFEKNAHFQKECAHLINYFHEHGKIASKEPYELFMTKYDFSVIPPSQIDYAKYVDVAVAFDVKSCYPTQMANHSMPCGDYKLVKADDDEKSYLLCTQAMAELVLCKNKKNIHRKLYKVTVQPAKDAKVAMLPKRKKDGRVLYDNELIEETWIWGIQLMEAIIQGAMILKVHAYMEWEHLKPLFKDFIEKLYAERKKHAKGSPLNNIIKLILNSSYGKMAQKPQLEKKQLIVNNPNKQLSRATLQDIDRATDFDIIKGKKGPHAVLITTKDEEARSPYLVYLAGFILAAAKEFMARLMRITGITFTHGLYYTDTDCLFAPIAILKELKIRNLIGENLGQLGDELGGDETFPAKIIDACFYGKKGPYGAVYANRDGICHYFVKCKGVPGANINKTVQEVYHGDSLIPDKIKLVPEENRKVLIELFDFLRNPYTRFPPQCMIGKSFFICYDVANQKVKFIRYLTTNDLNKCHSRKIQVFCIFGGMTRAMYLNGRVSFVRPKVTFKVTMSDEEKSYWNTCERICDKSNNFRVTYPKGYKPGRTEFDDQEEFLQLIEAIDYLDYAIAKRKKQRLTV
jgi:hypothetical protein